MASSKAVQEEEQRELFPDMKLPRGQKTHWEELQEMRKISEEEGLFLPPATAAVVLDISRERVRQLMESKRLRTHEYLGKIWVTQADMLEFVESGRKNGRPFAVLPK